MIVTGTERLMMATNQPDVVRASSTMFADVMVNATTDAIAAPIERRKVNSVSPRQTAPEVDEGAKLKAALAAFRKEASLTPAERARRDVLEAMNLTEDAIKAMTPEQQEATERKIAVEVARRLRLADPAATQPSSAIA